MSYNIYNKVGYGVILKISQWTEFESDLFVDTGLNVVNFGNNSSGDGNGMALVILDSLIIWDKYEPIFFKKIPFLDNKEIKEWNNKLFKWCDDNNIIHEPIPSYMIMNLGGL